MDEIITTVENLIQILRNKPQIQFIENCDNLKENQIVLCYPDYPNWVYEIEKIFHPVRNYLEIVELLEKSNKKISNYDKNEICCILTWFVRGERFCDGHMATYIHNGLLLQWLIRYKEMLEENK